MTFETAIDHILRHEGGYVNDPRDPGGETNWGISKRAYPDVNIKGLTREGAKAIYRRDYWDRCRCDQLPLMLRLPVFDMAVNQGAIAACKTLQRAAGVLADGIIGPATMAAVDADEVNVWIGFMSRRAQRYAENPQIGVYGKGWFNRLMDVAYSSLRRA
jgi:lysozyme family protein